MTAPVETDDVVQACAKYLLAQPECVAVVSSYTGNVPWIFQDTLHARPEGKSGTTAVVVSLAGGWGATRDKSTLHRPRIALEIFCDPVRDASFNVVSRAETRRRVMAVYKVFDRKLHRVTGDECWGSLRTVSSSRQGEIALFDVADGDGMLRGLVFYGVEVG